MKIVNFNQKYQSQVVELWNSTLVRDCTTEELFIKNIILEDNFDSELCFVGLEDDKVIAFLLASKRKFPYMERGLEPLRGWVNIMFVHKDYQNRGYGKQLLNLAEEKLVSMGATSITLNAYSPSYITPGIDIEAYESAEKLAVNNGYVCTEECSSMYKSLFNFEYPKDIAERKEKAIQAGFSFIPFENKYTLELLEFLKVNFGGGWKRNALLAMLDGRAEDTIILCLDKTGKIVGYAQREMDGNRDRFGPFGVLESLRSHGLGAIIFYEMQNAMFQRKIYNIYFLWATGGAKRFYDKHGFSVYRNYRIYKKEIK